MFRIITSIAVGVTASTEQSILGFLDHNAEELVGSLVGEFITVAEVKMVMNVGRLMMNKDWFVPEGEADPIEELMAQLPTVDRAVAVKHWITHNHAELSIITPQLVRSVGIVKLMAMQVLRNPPVAIVERIAAPLYSAVSVYVMNRRDRCMYDYVPMAFRDPLKYDELFTELDRETTTVRPSDAENFSAYITAQGFIFPFESYLTETWFNSGVSATVDRDCGIIKLERNAHTLYTRTRYLNPKTGCSCEVKSGLRSLTLFPKRRSLFFENIQASQGVLWNVKDYVPTVTFDVPLGGFADYLEHAPFFIAGNSVENLIDPLIHDDDMIPWSWEESYVFPIFTGEFAVCSPRVKDVYVTLYGRIFKMLKAEERSQISQDQLRIIDAIVYGKGDDVVLTENQKQLRELFRVFRELYLVEAFEMTAEYPGLHLHMHVTATLEERAANIASD